MQFSAVLNIFIVKTWLNSTFTNDLKRKHFFSKNVHSYRVCSFKILVLENKYKIVVPLFGAANAAPNKGTTNLY